MKYFTYRACSQFPIFVVLILLSSCGKVITSSSSDQSIYSSAAGTANFLAAKAVVAASCLNCHSAWGSYSEQDYVNNFLVTQGNPSASLLYTSLRGNDTGVAGTMPIGAANLTNEDMRKIRDWITQM